MSRRRRLIGMAIALAILILSLVTFLTAGAAPADQTAGITVSMTGATANGGSTISYSITVTNNSGAEIGGLYVTGSIPSGTEFGEATATPSGATFKAVENGAAAWVSGAIAAGGKAGPFTYTVKVDEAPAGPAHAWIHWTTPADGSAQSSEVTWQAAINAGGPKRGCQACHVLVDRTRGNYTLAFEASERARVDYGVDHPNIAPDGTSLKVTDQTGPAPCLLCHRPSPSDPGRGVGAPITLRDIVHPAHMFSATFVEHYSGNCFTCHNVRGDGTFELLGDNVVTNEKGVPRVLEQGGGSIPGSIAPSEGGR